MISRSKTSCRRTRRVAPWWTLGVLALGSACGSAATSSAHPSSGGTPQEAEPFGEELLGDLSQVSTPEIDHEVKETPVAPREKAEARPRYPGHLDPRVAERTLQDYEPLIRQCYETQKAELPKQTGKLTMFLVVRTTGRVSEARAVRNTTGSEALAQCVAQQLRSVVFAPGPTGGSAQYEYAFLFGQ
jgi:hypothetical protein